MDLAGGTPGGEIGEVHLRGRHMSSGHFDQTGFIPLPPDGFHATGDFGRALDVGTGSGVIALSLALKRPQAGVTGCDISREALALAAENAARHNLADRVVFAESDLLANISGPVDLIVANLPYISLADMEGLSREVRHDPVLALDGGADGMDVIRRLVSEAPRILSPGGILALEIGHDQSRRVCELLEALKFRDISPRRDYQNTERFIIARHG